MDYNCDTVIIGAGASGMMAAYFCAKNGKSVFLLDHNNAVGKKILISGGGKCNFTNMYGEFNDYYCENPHFVKSALSRYTVWDFLEHINSHEVPYEERELGKLFCKRSAKDINQMLLSLVNKSGAKLKLSQKNLDVEKLDSGWRVFNSEHNFYCENLVIATGGLVLPSIGASSFGHVIAKRYGHKIIPTTPALVPFIVPGFSEIRGNAFVAGITCENKYYVAENVLFTHKGLSGPGVLKASLHWNPGESIEINWLVNTRLREFLEKFPGNTPISKPLKKHLPNNFVDHFFDLIGFDGKKYISQLSKSDLNLIERQLHHMKIIPSGTEGFRKAEVTRGGVDTSKVSSKTMESQLRKGLYFIGEVLDVTGQLGGHNFQWCWASANAVGEAIG